MRESWKQKWTGQKKAWERPIFELKLEIGSFVKWMLLAVGAGLVIGGVGSVFGLCMNWVNRTRQENSWLLYFLPLAGLLIVFCYRRTGMERDGGTNTVLDGIRTREDIPFWMAPLIFVSTILTHLCGGSAGREGAALQIGGSLGNFLGKKLHLTEEDRKVLVMCGMSAAFSALFGTPVAAAVFSLEVVTVGITYYSALLPCALASLTAHFLATMAAGLQPETFLITKVPEVTPQILLAVIVIAAIGAYVATFFCWLLHRAGHWYRQCFANPYVRIAVAGVLVILFTCLEGSGDYNGAGMQVIERAFEGEVVPWAFLWKMLFTALTLGAGFRGGEIVPTFFVGATLGAWLGQLLGLPVSLCAGLGMGVLFCGVTNCPLSTLLICFELFNYQGVPYFLLAIAVSYLLSGYSGLYAGQIIQYSKFAHFLDREREMEKI